jgi:hypothetical protein
VIFRIAIVPILLCLACSVTYAQKKDDLRHIKEAGEVKMSFFDKQFYDENARLPFKNIIALDYRHDSSKLGYVDKFCNDAVYCKIRLSANWSAYLNNYFKGNLDPSSPHTLVIAIRSFWMQEGILDEMTDKKVVWQNWSSKDGLGTCKAAIDVFVKTGNDLVALFKVEDVFVNAYGFKPSRLKEWFFLPFDSAARKMATFDLSSSIAKKPKLSLSEVEEFYRSRFKKPVITNSTINQGVFLSFSDFLNNKPSSKDFRIKHGKLTDELYITGGREESVLADFWGAYDGQTLFIRSGFSLYPALKQQDSYEVYGAKHVSHVHNNPAPGELLRVNRMQVDEKILHLNMETGKFY